MFKSITNAVCDTFTTDQINNALMRVACEEDKNLTSAKLSKIVTSAKKKLLVKLKSAGTLTSLVDFLKLMRVTDMCVQVSVPGKTFSTLLNNNSLFIINKLLLENKNIITRKDLTDAISQLKGAGTPLTVTVEVSRLRSSKTASTTERLIELLYRTEGVEFTLYSKIHHISLRYIL